MSDNLKTLKYYNKTTSQKVPLRISTDQIENTEGKPLTQILVPATSDTAGLLTASDKVKMDKLVDLANYLPVTEVDMTGFVVGTYDETTSETSLSVLGDSDPRSKAYVITPPASSDRIGGVIPGTGLSVNSSGILSVNTATVMNSATNAATAASATAAGTANSATSASYATSAGSATSAGTAASATSASTTGYATSAGTATTATSAPNYLPLTGGTINGNLRIQSGNYGTKLNFGDGDYCYIHEPTDDNLTIHVNSGKNLNLEGNVQINGTNIEDLAVNQAKSVYVNNAATTGSMHLVKGIMNNDLGGIIVGSTASDRGYLEIATGDNGDEPIYVKQYSGTSNDFTGTARTATLLDANGNTSFPGQVTATKFVGTVDSAGVAGSATSASTAATCTGNAATASGFNAARTMTIVNVATSAVGSSTWDGKAAVTISMNIAARNSVATLADLDLMSRGRWVTNNNLLGFNETLHGEERHFGNLELQEMIPYTGWTWLRRCYTNNAWSAWYRYDANKKWDGTAWQLSNSFMSSVISATSAMTVPSASVATTSAKYATSAGGATSAGTCTGAAATAGTATVSAKYATSAGGATSAGTCTGAAATAGTATVSAKYATSAGSCTGNAATATTAGTATVSAKFATSATGATNAANAANANTASSAIRSYYTVGGVCSTAAATAQKDVTIANASTNSSAVITVLFTQKNTAANPTLCLNGGTAHKICTYSAVRPTAFTSGTNQAVSFMFYGTAWRIVHPGLA